MPQRNNIGSLNHMPFYCIHTNLGALSRRNSRICVCISFVFFALPFFLWTDFLWICCACALMLIAYLLFLFLFPFRFRLKSVRVFFSRWLYWVLRTPKQKEVVLEKWLHCGQTKTQIFNTLCQVNTLNLTCNATQMFSVNKVSEMIGSLKDSSFFQAIYQLLFMYMMNGSC